LKKHLTPSTVISCIALFVALSGAAYAASLGKNAVKTKNIANGAVTAAKIKGSSVNAAKIANGAVIGSKIANGAVGSAKLAEAAVRSSALGGGVVTTAKLKDLSVTEGKLGNNAVTNAKLGAGAVETGKLAKESVTAEKIAAGVYGQLVKNVAYVVAQSVSDTEEKPKAVTAQCPAGREAIGGGARVTGAEVAKVAVTESFAKTPDADGKRTGWTGVAMPIAPEAKAWGVEAVAICAEL
jgi:hypothetical protein